MKSKQTIAHLVPYSVVFPLKNHNGRYDWVIDLAARQTQNGFSVSIYSNPQSRMDIPGISWKSVDGTHSDTATANQALLLRALADEDVDVFHSHFDSLHYTVAGNTTKPIVFTQHWWPIESTISRATSFPSSNVWAVPPTHYMFDFDRESGIQTKGCIYHGIDLTKFAWSKQPRSDRLLFVGRIAPEKNLQTAITAARKAKLGLDIIGKVAANNHAFWESLLPLIDGEQIRYLGPKASTELPQYYSAARAVIFPSDIHEPFGLVAIEAQACGTPVLMKQGGSRGELVQDGATGFLCDTEDDFAAAAIKSDRIVAADCVEYASLFDVNRMVAEYSDLYATFST